MYVYKKKYLNIIIIIILLLFEHLTLNVNFLIFYITKQNIIYI